LHPCGEVADISLNQNNKVVYNILPHCLLNDICQIDSNPSKALVITNWQSILNSVETVEMMVGGLSRL